MNIKKVLFIFMSFLLPVFFVQAAKPTSKSLPKVRESIKILLVPGHDNEIWGTQYGDLKESSMNRVLAAQIYDLLKKDKRFKVYITRDVLGYTTEFADYLSLHETDIYSFRDNAKKEMKAQISSGSFVSKTVVSHNAVAKNTSLQLYGINKWANENKIDAVIHIHFNDVPRSTVWEIGEYKGFSIYIPDRQLANSKESSKLAGSIFSQLSKKYKTSTLPEEKGGLIPDQKLIALGASGTLSANVRSVLVEYGYIYEKMFRSSSSRRKAYKTMSVLTAQGIKNYFLQ